ncbi:MAG: Ferredoxin-4 [Candidatus Peregrinibacteria bacterium GW2011_GWA2_33_10]|nr:MAG: Ferredoxin-4 [Candidatus Peregrinibacteria bacterium GW2011_GWA2_33_10]KKP41298.1 MAG: ferredoxin-4 [Candidatus Peregrinibacteria bacterium GW2011_GWC2_33_13]
MSKVTFKNSGESATVNSGASLKELIEEKGWPVSFACENGICGTCLIKVVEGKEHLGEIKEQEKMTLEAMGMDSGEYRLACECVVGDGDVVIEG